MTTYRIPAPDGKTYRIEGPEGATQEQIQAEVIRQNPHLGSPVATSTGAAAIPTEQGANTTPTPDAKLPWYQTLANEIRGAAETPFALVAGTVGGAVGAGAGIGANLLSGKYGTSEGTQIANKTADQVSQQFFQPRTPEAQRNVTAIGNALGPLMGIMPNLTTMNELSRGAAPAISAVKDSARAVSASPLPMGATLEQQAAQNVANSYQNAGRIEAAKAGSALGLVADPAAMNPTSSTKFKSRVTDPKAITAAATKSNDSQVPVIAAKEMGLPENTSFTTETPFNQARELASGPYKEAAAIPLVVADDATATALNALKPKAIPGKAAEAAKNAGEIQLIIDDLKSGINGDTALNAVAKYRKDANSILNSEKLGNPLTSDQRDMASAYKGVADTIEDLIAKSNPEDPRFADRFNAARTQMAKIAAYQDAVNFGTGKFDPKVLAKQTAENPNLTGDIATIGKFTNNFPESMGVTTPEGLVGAGIRHVSRASVSGTIGAGLGSLMAPGPAGYLGGGAVGVIAGKAASALNARRMVSPSYQAKNAIPTDYRPQVNNLRPVEPNATPNGLMPYDYSNATAPNWVPGGRGNIPVATPYIEPGYPQLPEPSAQSTLQGVAGRRTFDYNMEKALAEQQVQQEASQAAGSRQTTGTGTPLVFDSLTGKLVPAGETLRGATPDIQVIESTGKSLASAANKVANGQRALMSADERIAWEKTSAGIASVEPGFKTLSASQVADKVMDRGWVNDLITKIRDKAAAFDEIARRSMEATSNRVADAKAFRDASMAREKMLELMSDLQDALSSPRPTRGGQQGPKTRQFNRTNNLAPQNQNNLAP